MKKKTNVSSVRILSGGAVVAINESNKLVSVQPDKFMFEVFLAYDSRKVHVPPLIFAAESESDRSEWIKQITIGAHWMYHPPLLRPLANRLCGLVVLEIMSVENVLVADWSGKSDPYVIIQMDDIFARTPTHYETLTASFSHFVTIPVLNDDPNSPITLFVLDEDSIKKDDMLGGVSLPLHSLGFNKEVVWDSIPLKRMHHNVAAKQSFGGDPFGTITFRTIYKSSKLTQLLPLNQPRHVVTDDDCPVTPVSPSSAPSSPKSPATNQKSPNSVTKQTSPKSGTIQTSPNSVTIQTSPIQPSPAADSDLFDYDFSIDIFKLQLARIGAMLATLKFFSGISYILQFRDPVWSSVIVGWLSWILLVEPGSALMFWYALLGKLMLQAHPSYPELVQELWARKLRFEARFQRFFSKKPPPVEIAPVGEETTEYRVFECQRRRIANALTMISTMVKVPANVAVAAVGMSENEESEEEDAGTVLNSARTEIGNLFKHFSAQNLKTPGEAEWVSITGVALSESPSTIIAGTKIKWSVAIGPTTDVGGWEYARRFPALLTHSVGALDYDSTVSIWNESDTKFSKNLKIHRHWVRRRMWIGHPIRPAFATEEHIRLSEIVEATIDPEATISEKQKKSSVFAKFRLIMTEGKKLQKILFSVSSQLESFKNLVSWKARWISSVIFVVLMVLFVAAIFVPQRVLCWVISMLIVLDSYSDAKIKQKKTRPLLLETVHQVEASMIPDQWKQILANKLISCSSKMTDITNEVSALLLTSIVQKALLVVFPDTRVVLTVSDLGEGHVPDGGPLTWGAVLENIYLKANLGNKDWWKSRKTSIHPKNLIKGHLVSDWEEFNPTSLFSKNK